MSMISDVTFHVHEEHSVRLGKKTKEKNDKREGGSGERERKEEETNRRKVRQKSSLDV